MTKQNLNNNTFFTEAEKECPKAVALFYKLFAQYSERNNLKQLFNDGYKNREAYGDNNLGWHQPGIKDIPIEMQYGIFYIFCSEMNIKYNVWDHDVWVYPDTEQKKIHYAEAMIDFFRRLEFSMGGLQRKEPSGQSRKV